MRGAPEAIRVVRRERAAQIVEHHGASLEKSVDELEHEIGAGGLLQRLEGRDDRSSVRSCHLVLALGTLVQRLDQPSTRIGLVR